MISEFEKEVYKWQMWVNEFGLQGQNTLKQSAVLVTRCGGLGSVVAYELAAAGIGKLVLAHGGNVKPSDLNRQILMTHDWLGKPRVHSARRRLLELNPRLEIEAVESNVTEDNVAKLVESVDVVVDCAPLFSERYLLNQQIVLQNKPMVECAMYELECQLSTILPNQTPCLKCLYPQQPSLWKREFPVFGAVSGSVGCMAAMEAIKVLSGIGQLLAGVLLVYDLKTMSFQKVNIEKNPQCLHCGK